jgi:hypothetical protein
MINRTGGTPSEADEGQEQNQKENEQHHQDQNARTGSPRGLILAAGGLENGGDSRAQPAVVIASLEAGGDFVIDDSFGHSVGQRPFKSIADFDPHAAILHKNEEDRAVVPFLLPNSPGFKHPMGIVLDRGIALHFGKNGDNDLARGRFFKTFKRLVQSLGGGSRDNAGIIIKIIRRLRRHDLAGQATPGEQRQAGQAGNAANYSRL